MHSIWVSERASSMLESGTRRKDDFADTVAGNHPDDELLAGGRCLFECLHAVRCDCAVRLLCDRFVQM